MRRRFSDPSVALAADDDDCQNLSQLSLNSRSKSNDICEKENEKKRKAQPSGSTRSVSLQKTGELLADP